jgi:primosomal protein N' (replication factor Y)
VQVSGRSGRKEKPGEVIIQTSNVTQPILYYITHQDFANFYNHEIEERYKYKYPPFFRLIRITLKHREQTVLAKGANILAEKFRKSVHKKLVLGPHEPMISKIRNFYLMEIIVKIARSSKELETVKSNLAECANSLRLEKEYKQMIVVFDVDPY